MDASRLTEAFAAIESHADQSEREFGEQLAEVEREISRQRRALDKLTAAVAFAEDDEEERSLRSTAGTIRDTLRDLTKRRDHLDTMRTSQPSHEGMETFRTFAADIAVGLQLATPSERRQILDLLQIRATITRGEPGVKIGRHAYQITWEGLVELGVVQNHPMRLNAATSTSPTTTMEPMANSNPYAQSPDGVKWKFIP